MEGEDILTEIEETLGMASGDRWIIRSNKNGDRETFLVETEKGERIIEIIPPIFLGNLSLIGLARRHLTKAAEEIRRLREKLEAVEKIKSIQVTLAPSAPASPFQPLRIPGSSDPMPTVPTVFCERKD